MTVIKSEMLRARAGVLRATRRFFDERGFIEVQTQCLSADNVVDAHIDPVEVPGAAILLPPGFFDAHLLNASALTTSTLNDSVLNAGSFAAGSIADTYYLQTSPEFAMKRLLALGVSSIYNLGPVFRAGERSPRHNIEFTMLEWYDVGASMENVIAQTIDLVELTLGKSRPRVVTYRELFHETLGFDPIDCPVDVIEKEAASVDASLARSLAGQRDELLDVLLTERIEPLIANESVLIRNYPITQAALARRSEEDPQTAERFELIVHGLELANGYGELLDADELLTRNQASNQKRIATGRRPLPIDSRLIAAMRQGLPPCSGVALGFDRLVMLAIGTKEIADVLAFPIETA